MNAISFVSFWVFNSLYFYLAFLIFPGEIVLGNNIRSSVVASMLAGFLLTIILCLVPLIMKIKGVKLKEEKQQALIYLVFNVVGIWVIARMAFFTGLGVSSFWVAIILGLVANFLQWGVWKLTTKQKVKK